MIFDIEEPDRKLVHSRLDVLKGAQTFSSDKVPILVMTGVMLLVKQRAAAEAESLVDGISRGGLVYTFLMVGTVALVNIYIFATEVEIIDCVRNQIGDHEVKLDFPETFSYLALYKFGWNKKAVKVLKFILDIIVIIQKAFSGMLSLVFALRRICFVANRYGNDLTEKSLCWYSIVPLLLLLHIGNLGMLAIVATVGNVISIGLYIYMLIDNADGLDKISQRKLFPTKIEDALATYNYFMGAFMVTYSGLTVRNEMKDERSCEKPLGALNISVFIIVVLHTAIPAMRYIKFDTTYMIEFKSREDVYFEMCVLLTALEKILTIPFDIYIAFHLFFPGLYGYFKPRHSLRFEFICKLVISLIVITGVYFINVSAVENFMNMTIIPILVLTVPLIFHIALPSRFVRKLFNLVIIAAITFLVFLSLYFWITIDKWLP